MKAFHELVIVEMAGAASGAYAAKLFADFGAQVVIVEPPGGDAARWTGASAGQSSAAFTYLNTGKSSLAVDAKTATGEDLLRRVCQRADVIIESFSPGPAEPLPDSVTSNEPTVRVRISPFGLDGPSSSYRSTPFTDFAVAGHMFLTGEPDRTPLQGAPDQSLFAAGTHAYIGALTALIAREATGRGQDIDISHFEVMTSLHQWTTVRYTHGGVIQTRVGNRYGSLHPSTLYECADGWVAFGAVGNEPLLRFLSLVGMESMLEDQRFASGAARFANADAFDAILGPWMKEHTVAEVVSLGQAIRAAVAPVNDLENLLADEHLAARRFWAQPEDSEDSAGEVRYPGPPFRMSGHVWALRRAPEAGAGSDRWHGLSADAAAVLRRAGMLRSDPHEPR